MVTTAINRVSELGGKIRRSAETINASTIAGKQRLVKNYYDLIRAYYNAEVYERADANVQAIKQWEGLPRYIRPIILVPHRAVEWWPGHLFPGAWTPDGLDASNGRPNMISYDKDTPEAVRLAVQMGFTWANGPRFLRRLGRTGAKLGNAFAEIADDRDRMKVYPVIIDPDYVIEHETNASGDLLSYRLAIPRYDSDARKNYLWGKLVTRESITTFYDDAEHSFVEGQPATIHNEFGFVPAVFVPHVDTGGPHGAPAIDGTLPLLDEINGLVSSVNDYIMRIANQHVIIESPNPKSLRDQLTTNAAAPRESTNDRTDYNSGRQETGVLPAPIGTRVHHLLEDIGLAASDPHIQRLEREIEKCFPEIVLSDKLLEMSQVTRPGAIPLVQDVQHKFDESAGNYYQGISSLGQMLCTMGGVLARSGAWGPSRQLSDHQRLFLPFSLDSFSRGHTAFSIAPAELIPKSFQELAAEAIALESIQTPSGLTHVGKSLDEIYGEGLAPEQLPGLLEQKESASASASERLAKAFNSGQG